MLATIYLLAATVGCMEMHLICLKFCTALTLYYSSALAKLNGIWSPFACDDKTMSLFVISYREQLPRCVLNPWHSSLQLYQNCLKICKPVLMNMVLLVLNSQGRGTPLWYRRLLLSQRG